MFPNIKIDTNAVLKRPPQSAKIKSPYSSHEETVAAFISKFAPNTQYTVKLLLEWHYYLTGSCPEGRVLFCHVHHLKRDTLLTTEEFFELTEEDVYGADTMKEVERLWREYYGR